MGEQEKAVLLTMDAISNFWLDSYVYVYVFCLCSEVTQLKELTRRGNSAVMGNILQSNRVQIYRLHSKNRRDF